MSELWSILFPILLADVVNPVLFAYLIVVAGTASPIPNMLAVLLGHTLSYFASGVIVALGLEKIQSLFEKQAEPSDFVIEAGVGLLLIWAAIPKSKKNEKQAKDPSSGLTPVKAFGTGMVLCLIGIPFAFPYFAAIAQILKADLNPVTATIDLLLYNALYASPFLLVPILIAVLGDKAKTLLQKINGVMEKVSKVLFPLILGLLGGALIADALSWFLTGKALF